MLLRVTGFNHQAVIGQKIVSFQAVLDSQSERPVSIGVPILPCKAVGTDTSSLEHSRPSEYFKKEGTRYVQKTRLYERKSLLAPS